MALLSGDFELGATGTVTHVDGDRVYAFGHPLYNLGPTEFPMTRADVHVVLPSLMPSSKLASLGPVVGTLQQDRATAIAGRLGPGPPLIPMTVSLNSDRLGSRTFNFGVVRDITFTPLLAYLAVANVLTAYERGTGPASFTIRGTASIRAHDELAFEDVFTGDQPVGARGGLHRRPADRSCSRTRPSRWTSSGSPSRSRPPRRRDRRASSACGSTRRGRARARPRWCRWRCAGRRAKRS